MPRHNETRILPLPQQLVFDVVADVASYPTFLPWCLGAVIHSADGQHIVADLTVGKGPFRETFTSHVTLDPISTIKVTYLNGPLDHLTNEWDFQAQGPLATKLTFNLDFALKRRLLDHLMGAFFQDAFTTLMHAFEAEADRRWRATTPPQI